jgi:hypothetical protein
MTFLWVGDGFSEGSPAGSGMEPFAKGPSVFIENVGQWADSSVRYALDGTGANVGLTDKGPRFQLFRRADGAAEPAAAEMREFALVFDGASPVAPVGRELSSRKYNYMLNSGTHSGVSSYGSVWYENLWPRISLEMSGSRTGVKYNFHIAPGGDWRSIKLRYDNVDALRIKGESLEIGVAAGWASLMDGAPYIYQEINGERQSITGKFVLFNNHTYGFEVTGQYDPALPLVIDPSVSWNVNVTSSSDSRAIARDLSGNCYVTGRTYTAGWTSGGEDLSYNGGGDAYVIKLDSSGTVQWSTYIGGTGTELGFGIAVDSGGNSYVCGQTSGGTWVSGGWQAAYGGGTQDAFVVKLNSNGVSQWSSFLGGSDYEYGYGIAADRNGNCYVYQAAATHRWMAVPTALS